MNGKNIAFFLDQAYGNIVPSLGIAMELIRRGHNVTYIVTESFSSLIHSVGATPVVIDVMEVRQDTIAELVDDNDHRAYKKSDEETKAMWKDMCERRTHHMLPQLDRMYATRKPDLVVYDDILETAGSAFARRQRVSEVRLATQFIEESRIGSFPHDQAILITVPKFFHRRLDQFEADPKFKFVGFIPEGRSLPFRPWRPLSGTNPRVLVAPTTGLLQQIDFCKKIVEIFRDQPWDAVLSISGSHDKLSAFAADVFNEIPSNIHINRLSGNFDIAQNVDLFIGQAGQGGTLEAIYWGLPQILLPPTPYHHSVARRVTELGLGVCLPPSEMSREALLGHATTLLNDNGTLTKVREFRDLMRQDPGAKLAADILEDL